LQALGQAVVLGAANHAGVASGAANGEAGARHEASNGAGSHIIFAQAANTTVSGGGGDGITEFFGGQKGTVVCVGACTGRLNYFFDHGDIFFYHGDIFFHHGDVCGRNYVSSLHNVDGGVVFVIIVVASNHAHYGNCKENCKKYGGKLFHDLLLYRFMTNLNEHPKGYCTFMLGGTSAHRSNRRT
jgi:hypothetical protein